MAPRENWVMNLEPSMMTAVADKLEDDIYALHVAGFKAIAGGVVCCVVSAPKSMQSRPNLYNIYEKDLLKRTEAKQNKQVAFETLSFHERQLEAHGTVRVMQSVMKWVRSIVPNNLLFISGVPKSLVSDDNNVELADAGLVPASCYAKIISSVTRWSDLVDSGKKTKFSFRVHGGALNELHVSEMDTYGISAVHRSTSPAVRALRSLDLLKESDLANVSDWVRSCGKDKTLELVNRSMKFNGYGVPEKTIRLVDDIVNRGVVALNENQSKYALLAVFEPYRLFTDPSEREFTKQFVGWVSSLNMAEIAEFAGCSESMASYIKTAVASGISPKVTERVPVGKLKKLMRHWKESKSKR